MGRERIKTVRPDGTGFARSVRSGGLRTSGEPMIDHASDPDRGMQAGTAFRPDLEAVFSSSGEGPSEADGASPLSSTTAGADAPARDAPTGTLHELVVPPRSNSQPGSVPLTLRLRVLPQHAAALRELETRGIWRARVLRAAFTAMPTVSFVPRYIPQLSQRSGSADYSYRFNARISIETLRAIQDQVRNGEAAPRSTLLLGQIEPAWFASLDHMIKESLK